MPTYTYRCRNGHDFELKQDFTASPKHGCPTCGVVASRTINAVGVIYKGTGFYTTDYRKPEPSGSAPSSKPAAAKPAATASPANPAPAPTKPAPAVNG